jgi:hypothetical protein
MHDEAAATWKKEVLTPEVITKINAWGRGCSLEAIFTLVAVVRENGESFVSRYNSNLHANEDPIDKMVSGTKNNLIRPPVLVFLFDDSNRPALQGEIYKDANGQLALSGQSVLP